MKTIETYHPTRLKSKLFQSLRSNLFSIIFKTNTVALLLFCGQAEAQFNPQTKKITTSFFPDHEAIQDVTPALQKKKGFTDYESLITFLEQLKTKYPTKITLEYLGESQKGYAIPMVKITNPNSQINKTKVWMQGGLHGNEPASSEGMLYLLHEILHNSQYHYLFDKIELAMVPMANIDGYLKQDRYAANGLDLNRDQTKLMAPESIVLKQAFSSFNPAIGVDFHEYNPYRKDFTKLGSFGVTAAYDVMFLYSGNLNVPENLRNITDSVFVENARKLMDINKLTHHDYVSTDDYHGSIIFNQGSTSPRSSATSYALTNTISTLIEVRGAGLGRTSFRRRIHTTFLIGISYLETAYKNESLVKNAIATAQKQQETITVSSSRAMYQDTIQMIDLDSNQKIDLEVTVRNALQAKPTLVRQCPAAYLIPSSEEGLIFKLKTLGIKVDILQESKTYIVEAYRVVTYESNGLPYEKMNLQDVTTLLEETTIDFAKGTFIIETNQKNAPLLTEVLEPEAPSSFVSFGVLKTELNQQLPIYRLAKKK
jgi:hypothetical protein